MWVEPPANDLQSHHALELHLAGLVNDPHAAVPQLPQDLITGDAESFVRVDFRRGRRRRLIVAVVLREELLFQDERLRPTAAGGTNDLPSASRSLPLRGWFPLVPLRAREEQRHGQPPTGETSDSAIIVLLWIRNTGPQESPAEHPLEGDTLGMNVRAPEIFCMGNWP